MAEREPALLRDHATAGPVVEPPRRVTPIPSVRRDAATVHVVGFWRRAAGAVIDLAIVIPIALVITWIVSKIAGVHLPPSNLKLLDVDLWLDLALQTDPALFGMTPRKLVVARVG